MKRNGEEENELWIEHKLGNKNFRINSEISKHNLAKHKPTLNKNLKVTHYTGVLLRKIN